MKDYSGILLFLLSCSLQGMEIGEKEKLIDQQKKEIDEIFSIEKLSDPTIKKLASNFDDRRWLIRTRALEIKGEAQEQLINSSSLYYQGTRISAKCLFPDVKKIFDDINNETAFLAIFVLGIKKIEHYLSSPFRIQLKNEYQKLLELTRIHDLIILKEYMEHDGLTFENVNYKQLSKLLKETHKSWPPKPINEFDQPEKIFCRYSGYEVLKRVLEKYKDKIEIQELKKLGQCKIS